MALNIRQLIIPGGLCFFRADTPKGDETVRWETTIMVDPRESRITDVKSQTVNCKEVKGDDCLAVD